MDISDEVKLAMINAAKDITVAKINAKGWKFDQYTVHKNWFYQSLSEVRAAYKEVIERVR